MTGLRKFMYVFLELLYRSRGDRGLRKNVSLSPFVLYVKSSVNSFQFLKYWDGKLVAIQHLRFASKYSLCGNSLVPSLQAVINHNSITCFFVRQKMLSAFYHVQMCYIFCLIRFSENRKIIIHCPTSGLPCSTKLMLTCVNCC